MMRTVTYGDSVYHTMDLYGSGPHLVVFVHGGLYVNGDKGEHAKLASLLAGPEWTVAVPNYRLSGETSKDRVVAPAHTHDVAAAVLWLMDHCHPLQWAIVGHSCGAHMAALLLINPQFRFFAADRVPPPPVAMIGVQGMYDNNLFCADFPAWAGELHLSHTGDPSTWLEPTRAAPSNVTALRAVQFHLVHAVADRYVNIGQALAFQAALQGWGIASTLHGGPGDHWDGVRGDQVEWLAQLIGPILRASLETMDGADERRRMNAAGYREGHEAGETHAVQESFNEGFRTESSYWLELSRLLGTLHHAVLLDGSLKEATQPHIDRLRAAVASGTRVELPPIRDACIAILE